MWPVKDAAGKTIPGAWFAGHDYISSPSQCGIGATNCDYQDNVYLITNILPVASSDTTAPAAPAAPTGAADTTGVNLSWPASSDADLIGYRVERSSAAAGPWTTVSGTGLVTATSFRDTSAGPAAATLLPGGGGGCLGQRDRGGCGIRRHVVDHALRRS